MKTKVIALFLILNLFSAASVFASRASAKNFANPPSPSYGGMCEVEIHNHTNWTVAVWVDGEFIDYLRPHSHMTVSTGSGYTRLSARADFTNRPSVRWNSTYFFYPGYTYPWILEG